MTPLAPSRTSSLTNYFGSYFTFCKKSEQESIKSLVKRFEEVEKAIEENLDHIELTLDNYKNGKKLADLTAVINRLKSHIEIVRDIRYKVRFRIIKLQKTCWGYSTRNVKYYTCKALSGISILAAGGSFAIDYLKKDEHNRDDHALRYLGVGFLVSGYLISELNATITKKWKTVEKRIALMKSISKYTTILIRHTESKIVICSYIQATKSLYEIPYEIGLKKFIHFDRVNENEFLSKSSQCENDDEALKKMLRDGSERILQKNNQYSDISRGNIAPLDFELTSIQIDPAPNNDINEKKEDGSTRTTPTPPVIEEKVII